LNGALWAGTYARRLATFGQPVVAHIAFSDDAALWVVLRHAIGAIPRTVLAADACFGTVQNYARDGILRIRIHGTSSQAGGLDAVIASHRQMQPLCVRIPAAFDFADPPPVNFGRIAVLLVASHNTTLAADAFGHIEMKAVLLAGQETALGNQRRL